MASNPLTIMRLSDSWNLIYEESKNQSTMIELTRSPRWRGPHHVRESTKLDSQTASTSAHIIPCTLITDKGGKKNLTSADWRQHYTSVRTADLTLVWVRFGRTPDMRDRVVRKCPQNTNHERWTRYKELIFKFFFFFLHLYITYMERKNI
jgi:hypothetical protein